MNPISNSKTSIAQIELSEHAQTSSNEIKPLNSEPGQSYTERNFNRTGHWSKKQKVKHAMFLKYYGKLLQNKSSRKSFKIFKMMSEFIKTRDQNQCRGHYHKAICTYHTNEKIIQSAKNILSGFDQEFEKLIPELEKIDQGNYFIGKDNNLQAIQNEKLQTQGWELNLIKQIFAKRQRQYCLASKPSSDTLYAEPKTQEIKFNQKLLQNDMFIDKIQTQNQKLKHGLEQFQTFFSLWEEKVSNL